MTSVKMSSQVLDAVRKFCIPFIVWTVTSFLCHKMGKEFLMNAQSSVTSSQDRSSTQKCVLALILTVAQSLVCLMTVSPTTDMPKSGMSVTMAAHFLATLATNLSMAFIHAASTFAIKLTEPVTMVIAHRLAFKTSVSIETWFSLPLIIIGAFIFTDAALDESTTLGVSLAMASNLILAARNVSMKKFQKNSSSSKSDSDNDISGPKTKKVLRLHGMMHLSIVYGSLVLCVIFYIFLQNKEIMSVPKPYMTLMALLGSAVFHVSYSYISTNLVLRAMTVVSHSVANIFKRLLVVLMLYAGGHRSAAVWSWLGLGLTAVGLAIYVIPQLQQMVRLGNIGLVNGGSGLVMMKRACFLIVGLVMCLVTFTMFLMSIKIIKLQTQLQNLQANHKEHKLIKLNSLPLSSALKNQNTSSKILDSKETKDFLSKRLLDYPTETDFLAKQLVENEAIVAEAQRLHMSVMRDLLGKARHVMLFEIATYENKGDPAISVGETLLLRKLNLTVVYYCATGRCDDKGVEHAKRISQKYDKDELVILMQGGGNLVGYIEVDVVRERVLNAFPNRLKILFSQSIWIRGNIISQESLKYCRRIYSNRTNFVMFLRDQQSLGIAKENFKDVKFVLMPDMAFNIGMVSRQLPPAFDVLWLKREDAESPNYDASELLKRVNFTHHVSDYNHKWPSNKGETDMERTFIITSTGLQFLQRGRVIITDRLHGHILSTLLNIPHVLFDNPPFLKLSSFHKSWTASQSSVVLVDNMEQAIIEAQKLLKRYDSVLPKIGPYMSESIWDGK